MTELLCHEDAYLREFDATLVEVADDGVVLDRTAFYPGGGGQPPDTGVLRADGVEYRVKGISRSGGSLVHRTGSGRAGCWRARTRRARLGTSARSDADAHRAAHPVRGGVA